MIDEGDRDRHLPSFAPNGEAASWIGAGAQTSMLCVRSCASSTAWSSLNRKLPPSAAGSSCWSSSSRNPKLQMLPSSDVEAVEMFSQPSMLLLNT